MANWIVSEVISPGSSRHAYDTRMNSYLILTSLDAAYAKAEKLASDYLGEKYGVNDGSLLYGISTTVKKEVHDEIHHYGMAVLVFNYGPPEGSDDGKVYQLYITKCSI
jgi:hypothetical protein